MKNGNGKTGEHKHHHRAEILAATLLALATIASAWSAYQSSRWHGAEAALFAEATATRIKAGEAAGIAEQELEIDTTLFADYVIALFEGQTALVRFYEDNLFRPELQVALDAWKQTDPLVDPSAPGSPFEMEEYENASLERSRRLEVSAQKKSAEAREAIEHADRYVLLTVLFASVLFFAGISTKFESLRIKVFLLGFGWAVFSATLIALAVQKIA